MNDSFEKFKEIFVRSKISDNIYINNILVVIDETEDREEFIFNLVEQLHRKTNASFIFLLAVRGYLSQAKNANIRVETLPELINRIKKRFSGEKELFDVALIPDETETPFNRINEIVSRRKIDLIVIPAPFTLFAPEEKKIPGIELGTTIEQVIEEFLFVRRIPLYLVLKAQKTPTRDIKVLIRRSIFQNNLLGWLIAMVEEDVKIDVYYSKLVTDKELKRIKIFFNLIKERLLEDGKKILLYINKGPVYLKEFCSITQKTQDTLLVFQAIKTIENDAKTITSSICLQKSNVLIFPPSE